MATDVPLRCRCGTLRGVLRGAGPRGGGRVVCYCDDCQSFACFLGDAEAVLDAHGGTDIFQTSPARVEFTQGAERLACVRLRPAGLLRWYAACCRTPIGNTSARRGMPFVGLIHSALDAGPAGPVRDAALGPVAGRVFQKFARGERAALPPSGQPLVVLIARFALRLLAARLRGDQQRSPFFGASGAPVVTPHVLSAEELRRVEAARDAR